MRGGIPDLGVDASAKSSDEDAGHAPATSRSSDRNHVRGEASPWAARSGAGSASEGWFCGWQESFGGPAVQLAGVSLLYFAASHLGYQFATVGGVVSLVWPPSGLALVAALVFGYRICLGVAAGQLIANLSVGISFGVAALMGLGAALGAAAGAALLTRVADFRPDLNRGGDVLGLLLFAAVASTAVSAIVGVGALVAGGVIPATGYLQGCINWWLGDMMGVLVVAPPLLLSLTHARPRLSARQWVEALALATALGAIGYLIFGAHELAGHGYYPASLAIFPVVIWAALRFDHWGATLATLGASIMAVWGTTRGNGPFASLSAVDSLVRWSTFVNVVAVTGLLLAALRAQERRAQRDLKASHDELERRVDERTRELANAYAGLQAEVAERRRLEGRLIQLGDDQQKAIGRELHDGLGQHLTCISLLAATWSKQLGASPSADLALPRRIAELASEAVATAKGLARGLYPVALESRGLTAALQDLAANTRSLAGIACSVRAGRDEAVSDPLVAINLYRVAQEAVNNALKYSQARHVWIDLSSSAGLQTLAVSDDGIGISVESVHRGPGLGMHSLRQRAALLGGTVAIERNPHGGTTVAVSYPLGGRSP